MTTNSRVCASCVQEPYLQLLIDNSPIKDQECDFCEQMRATIPMDELADLCDGVLSSYYEPTSLADAVVIECQEPDGYSLRDTLDELLGAKKEVLEELTEALTDRWFDWSIHEHLYGDDPYFVERSRHFSTYGAEWQQMEHSLQTQARLLNPRVSATLERVFGPIHQHQTWRGGGVIVELGDGTETDTLFRARVFQELEGLERALFHPAHEVGPPPPGLGRAGRMNAHGISVFYGATLPNIAIAEVRPPVGSHVLVGKFKIVRRLKVLDLDKLEELVLGSQASLFDPRTKDLMERIQFLKSLSFRMVMPVMPDHENDGYLITQAIADFLATHPQLNLDGMLFKSVQYQGVGSDAGHNVVLFNKASRVSDSEAYAATAVDDVQLFETDEDGDHWVPNITLRHPDDIESPKPWMMEKDARIVALKIELDQLEISKIEGAQYRTSDTRVPAHTKPKRQS